MFSCFANMFLSSFLWITQQNRTNLKKLQNQAEHNTTNIQIPPDYSSATTIMLVMFWTEGDFCIICLQEFIQQQTLKLTNKQKNF